MTIKKFSVFLIVLLSLVGVDLRANITNAEGLTICEIQIHIDGQIPADTSAETAILNKMHTKVGDPFSQNVFDLDLKALSEDNDFVTPTFLVRDGQLCININVQTYPTISKITICGNKCISLKKIRSELELKGGDKFNRDEFYKSINKVRDYYIKKGFFEAQVSYSIDHSPFCNEVAIDITICEGKKGHINQIVFNGFTREEKAELRNLIRTKRYNFLMSWMTGHGVIKKDEYENDVQVVTTFMQNRGFADAHVKIETVERKEGGVALVITLNRGKKYFIGDISFKGYTIKDETQLRKGLAIKPGDVFSPEAIRKGVESTKEVYSNEGYIDTVVQYSLKLHPDEPVYDVTYDIEESPQYRVGIVTITGNRSTSKCAILNRIHLRPGETFDSRQLKATQMGLMNSGFFKSANVYTVKNSDDPEDAEFRDVVIEVEETSTGSMSLFVGFNSTDSIFGGLDLTENNFNIAGLKSIAHGTSCLRGGGEYVHIRASLGAKENSVLLSWMDPYFNDSPWRVGFDFNYTSSGVQSSEYDINSLGGDLFANYPISRYLTQGAKWRIKKATVNVDSTATLAAKRQALNDGIVTGGILNLNYDSTNSIICPTRGIRSYLSAELAGVKRDEDRLNKLRSQAAQDGREAVAGIDVETTNFLFLKYDFINSIYIPCWKGGTLKGRADFRFIDPFFGGIPADLPMAERFFLGGETSVRGIKPARIGPRFTGDAGEPTGGISSVLGSVEFQQRIVSRVAAFVFADAGAISQARFAVGDIVISYGVGVRIDIGQGLPFMFGVGFPVNPQFPSDVQKFFFSMGGNF